MLLWKVFLFLFQVILLAMLLLEARSFLFYWKLSSFLEKRLSQWGLLLRLVSLAAFFFFLVRRRWEKKQGKMYGKGWVFPVLEEIMLGVSGYASTLSLWISQKSPAANTHHSWIHRMSHTHCHSSNVHFLPTLLKENLSLSQTRNIVSRWSLVRISRLLLVII